MVLGLVTAVGGMVYSMVIFPAVTHTGAWGIPDDAWISMVAAHYVGYGTAPIIYQAGYSPVAATKLFVAGPLLAFALAPIAVIGDAFHLAEGYPLPLAHPSMWPLLGTFGLLLSIPLFYAIRALAADLGVTSRLWLIQAAVGLLVVIPVSVVYGHYEDTLALACLLLAVRRLRHEGWIAGARWLAAAILFKQWAILAAPIYIVATPRGRRAVAAFYALGVPAVVFGFFLAADTDHAGRALFRPPSFPQFGHRALWIAKETAVVRATPTRLGAVVVALVLAWVVSRRPGSASVLGAMALAFLARPLFEPVVYAYYLAPGLALAAMAALAAKRPDWSIVGMGVALTLFFLLYPDLRVWWAGFLALYAVALVVTGGFARKTAARPLASDLPVLRGAVL